MTTRRRTLLLLIDGLALLGVLIFSVLAALEPEVKGYVIGQIISAGIVLGSVLLLRHLRHPPP